MFTALFDLSGELSVAHALLLMLSAAACGLLIALCAALTGRCARSFAVSLVVLPIIVQVVILMVNGNVGTGVAVMGAFSLVRFRSAPGSSREITLIFLAMCAGLATGMAYAGYALAATAAVCFAAFLGWQYFVENYPPVQPVLSRVELGEENQWRREEETVVFDSVFHRREVVNDIDSDSAADLRLLDGQGNVALEATVEPGQAVKLEGLERNTPYTVEVRGGPFLLLRFF